MTPHIDPFIRYVNLASPGGLPSILLLGDSQIARWHQFAKDPECPDEYRNFLKGLHFIGVGGSKTWNLLNYIEGIGLPPKK